MRSSDFGFAYVSGWDAALNLMGLAPFSAVANYVLSMVPLLMASAGHG